MHALAIPYARFLEVRERRHRIAAELSDASKASPDAAVFPTELLTIESVECVEEQYAGHPMRVFVRNEPFCR